MEKITLKPAAKEFLYKSSEENVYFDVSSYYGSTNQEKNLGALFIISSIKYSDEDLSYLVSLISSLAKREYYSEISLREQNPKEAFSRALKKLNEVLEEFFQNKNFKLNIGLAAISGENIFISRLGKFKINLSRGNQFIDILNNVELFRMNSEREKQFSNIISGRLQPNDRLFAFFPTRSITSREKQLNDVFAKEGQEEFGRKVAHLAANVNNFSCCGVHIDMQQIREIPFKAVPKYSIPLETRSPSGGARGTILSQVPPLEASAQVKVRPSGGTDAILSSKERGVGGRHGEKSELEQSIPEDAKQTQEEKAGGLQTEERPRIIPAELSITKRSNIFTLAAAQLEKLGLLSRANNKTKLRILIPLAAVVIIALTLLVSFRNASGPQTQNAITAANENLKLAQSRLGQNNIKEARSLLQAALLNIADLPSKKTTNDVRGKINQILANLDKTSEKQPAIFLNFGEQMKNSQAILITAQSNKASIVNAEGKLFSIAPDGITELGELKTAPKFLFSAQMVIAAFDGSGKLAVLDLKSKKIVFYSLSNPVPSADSVLYKDNLYTLSENSIYKYADAATGGTKRTEWGNDSASGKLIALAADGNIYALNDAGKLIKYYKGKKLGEFDLQITPPGGSKIFTAKDSAFLYLADKTNRKVYVFDKASGELKTSYDLAAVGKVQDIFISPDGTLWVLSTDNKIWSLK